MSWQVKQPRKNYSFIALRQMRGFAQRIPQQAPQRITKLAPQRITPLAPQRITQQPRKESHNLPHKESRNMPCRESHINDPCPAKNHTSMINSPQRITQHTPQRITHLMTWTPVSLPLCPPRNHTSMRNSPAREKVMILKLRELWPIAAMRVRRDGM